MAVFAGKSALAVAASMAMAGAAPAAAVPADLAAQADAYLEAAWPADGPGAAVIITDDGRTVYARGRGLADLEARTPITPDSVFRLGSITKQFTAAIVLQLVQEGRLSLDDPVAKFLPGYPEPGASATVRQLLNHTVGIQSYTNIPGWMVEENTARPHTTEELIAHFRDLPAPSRPGQAWAYNNSGYVLLGAIVEAVTGMPWHRAVDERIARPLGLAGLRYGEQEGQIAAMARGYTADESGTRPARRIHMSVPHAAGALVGTVGDLAAWAQALHHGRVVTADSYAAMTAPTQLPGGETVPYGFGLGFAELRGRASIGHGGGIFGFVADSLYIPEEDIFIAILTNSDAPATPPGVAQRRLAALALGDPFPSFEATAVDAATLEPLFGVYRIESDQERRFFARDGRLYTQRSGASELEVFAAGDDRFFYGPASLAWFDIRRDAEGRPVMEMHQDGAVEAERAVRTGPIPPEPAAAEVPHATLASYVGSYALRQGTVTIGRNPEGGLTVRLGGQPALALRPVSATEFRVQGVDARLVFAVDGDAVTGLTIYQGAREMAAERVATGS